MRGFAKKMLMIVPATILAVNTAVAGGYAGGYYGYSKHGHHSNHGHGDIGLALGFGVLFGTLLGHALSEPRYPRYKTYEYYDTPRDYRRHHYHRHYYEYDKPRVVYREYREALPAFETNGSDGSCLQEREYQTKVIIDGKEVEAYGTACLQPDGSWRRGTAKLIPNY